MSSEEITNKSSSSAALRSYFASRPRIDAAVTSKVLDEHKPVLESMGFSETKMGDFYKQLQLNNFNNEQLYFGESLANLVDKNAVYARVAGTTATDYVKQRTQVLAESIAVFEKAKETGNPHLLLSFLNMVKGGAKTADKASVHEDEMFKAAQHAVSHDAELSRMLGSESKSFIYDPKIFEATLHELKARHQHLAEVNAVAPTNIEKHGAAGGLRDFGWWGALQTSLAGWAMFRKVNTVDVSGNALFVKDLLSKAGKPVPETRMALRQWITNIGRATQWSLNAVENCGRGIGSLFTRVPWTNVATVAARVPAVGWILAGAALAVGIGKSYCYTQENPDWAKPIVETVKATPRFLYNTAGYAAMFSPIAIPDFAKLWGSSWYDSNNLDELRNHVRGSQMKGVSA